MLEPTDNTLQAGCLGSVNALARFRGEAPTRRGRGTGVNAIRLAAEGLAPLARRAAATSRSTGSCSARSLTPTQIEGGVADNVVPDRVEATLNFRYAPDRSPRGRRAAARAT